MAFLTRLSRLFRADLHAVLDRLEAPDILLRQAIRDMEQAVTEGERLQTSRQAQIQGLQRRRDDILAAASGIDEQLELCLSAENPSLARVLVRRQLEGERLLTLLQRQAEQLEQALAEQARVLETQRQQLARLREQAAAFEDTCSPENATWGGDSPAVSDADVELALLKVQRGRS